MMQSPLRNIPIALFRFFLVTLLAFVLLAGTTALVAFGLAYWYGGPWNHASYLVTGVCCGLIIWLFVAVFHLRRETQELAFSQSDQFLNEASAILQQMGYTVTAQDAQRLRLQPSFHSYLFGGGIDIVLDGHLAKLTGPKLTLEMFRRFYRWQHYVQRVQQVLLDQRKITDTRLKRVELRLRLQPEQFEAVRKNVISVLEEDGDVICELNVLVNSVTGIREETLDFQIREWLGMKGISFDLHKDLVQFTEVVPLERQPIAV